MTPSDPGQTARSIIDASRYLVLATADATGRPWSSPVYFAHIGYSEFLWISSPDALHSRNIAGRQEVGIAVFDSHAPIGTGQGAYLSAVAGEVADADLESAMAAFSRRSRSHGGDEWSVEDVQGDSGLRLYHAVADSAFVLAKDGQPDHRIQADPTTAATD